MYDLSNGSVSNDLNFVVIQNISASFSELFLNYAPRPPLPRKVGGHDHPSSYGSAAPRHNSAQLNSTRQREQQLTQFVGRDVINKNTTDLAVRCSTGSVELS